MKIFDFFKKSHRQDHHRNNESKTEKQIKNKCKLFEYDEDFLTLNGLKDDLTYEICYKIHEIKHDWNNIELQEELEELADNFDKVIDLMLYLEEKSSKK